MSERILVTGATGCIGRATVKWLRGRGYDDLVALTRSGSIEGMDGIRGDISEAGDVEAAMGKVAPARVIHLAGWQTPDCQANPFGGMAVNLRGTENVVRALAKQGAGVERFVFASSAAVYGSRDLYVGDTVREDAPCRPPHLYGIWKVAGEGMAQAFAMETGIATISLRLATTYGPGRDRGLTAAPTTAIKAIASGESYAMPYFGREHYHYVSDVGAAFGMSATAPFSGYGVFNVRGTTVSVEEFLALLDAAAKEKGIGEGARAAIAEDAKAFPFVCELDDRAIVAAFPEMPLTSLRDGIRESMEVFEALRDR
ncbi:MAG: NAD(P)-dependent oxidoreductase [Verrucomicrobiota bacterium]